MSEFEGPFRKDLAKAGSSTSGIIRKAEPMDIDIADKLFDAQQLRFCIELFEKYKNHYSAARGKPPFPGSNDHLEFLARLNIDFDNPLTPEQISSRMNKVQRLQRNEWMKRVAKHHIIECIRLKKVLIKDIPRDTWKRLKDLYDVDLTLYANELPAAPPAISKSRQELPTSNTPWHKPASNPSKKMKK